MQPETVEFSSRDGPTITADVYGADRAAGPAFVTQFTPAGAGAHGSRMLWARTPGHQECWSSLLAFLGEL